MFTAFSFAPRSKRLQVPLDSGAIENWAEHSRAQSTAATRSSRHEEVRLHWRCILLATRNRTAGGREPEEGAMVTKAPSAHSRAADRITFLAVIE